jgi:hypothetical protein
MELVRRVLRLEVSRRKGEVKANRAGGRQE